MPTLQIRDLPQELYDSLVESAEANRRSLTQEAVVILEKNLLPLSRRRQKEMALLRLKELGAKYLNGVTIDEIVETIKEDRER
jgi:plasmid stability protein